MSCRVHYEIHGTTSDGRTLFNVARSLSEAASLSFSMWGGQVLEWRCTWCRVRIREVLA